MKKTRGRRKLDLVQFFMKLGGVEDRGCLGRRRRRPLQGVWNLIVKESAAKKGKEKATPRPSPAGWIGWNRHENGTETTREVLAGKMHSGRGGRGLARSVEKGGAERIKHDTGSEKSYAGVRRSKNLICQKSGETELG